MPDVGSAQAPVALIFDYASHWAWESLPQGGDFDYFRLLFSAYRALRRAGFSVDILPPDHTSFASYALVLEPGLASETNIEAALTLYGPRSRAVTAELSIPSPLPPNVPGLDVTVAYVESLPLDHQRPAAGGTVRHWMEHLEGTAPVLMKTDSGAPLMVGTGADWYLGGWPDDPLWDQIIAKTSTQAGLTARQLPDGLRCRRTDSHEFLINYTSEAIDWEGQRVPACGVISIPI